MREEGGAFLCQGNCAARRSRARCCPLPAPSRGAGLSRWLRGAVGVGLVSRAVGAQAREPRATRSPSFGASASNRLRRPPASPLGSPLFPAPAAAPPPPSSPGPSASRSRAFRGAARAGRRGAAARGRGRRAAGQPSTSSERRANGPRGAAGKARPRPARAEPFVPSQKFACRDRDSCGRGGRRGRRAGGGGE